MFSAMGGEAVPLRRWLGASVAIVGVAVVLLA
jgi:drug/metabolite transporter (DMT)-like permease